MVDHELEFGWLECGQQANAVMEDGRMLVVTRLADRTLAAIWEPGGDPRTMPDKRVFCLELSERPELKEIAILRRNEERLDARLTAVRTALDAAGVPEMRPYTETERAGMGVAGCPVGTEAGVMIPLEDRVRLLVAERDRLRDQVQDQTHDVRREVADLHAMLDAAGCASIRPRSFDETQFLSGEEIAALPLQRYELTDRVMQVIAERDEYRTRLGEAHTRLLAVALAQEHCPKPVLGQAWLTDGIPLLAERAKRAEAEVARLREAIKTAHADGASALVASFENTDPKARVCELEAEVARLKKERGNED